MFLASDRSINIPDFRKFYRSLKGGKIVLMRLAEIFHPEDRLLETWNNS
jgi:hypothetical protein